MAVETDEVIDEGVADGTREGAAQDASRARQLRAAQGSGTSKANAQGVAQGAADVQKEVHDIQTILKGVKIGSAASVIGLVITAIIMTYEFLLGNWLHIIPSRISDIEKGALAILWVVIALAVLIVFVIFFIIVAVVGSLF